MSSITDIPLAVNSTSWIVAAFLASVLVLVYRLTAESRALSKFPLLGKELQSRRERVEKFFFHPVELYEEGYRIFKDQIYRLTFPDGQSVSS